jgi:hypothetical protein
MHDTYKQYEHSAIQPFSGSGVQQCCTVTAAPSSAELGRQAGLGLPAAIATRKRKGAGDLVGAWLSGSYVRASPTCFCFANTARLDGADRAGGRPKSRVVATRVVHQRQQRGARGHCRGVMVRARSSRPLPVVVRASVLLMCNYTSTVSLAIRLGVCA